MMPKATTEGKQLRYRGRKQSVSAWAREFGLTPQTLSHRLYRMGWPLDEALNTPAWKRRKPAAKRVAVAPIPPPSFENLLARYRGPAIDRALAAGLALAEERRQRSLHGHVR